MPMKLLKGFLSPVRRSCALERYISKIDPKWITEKLRHVPSDEKLPLAQAASVLVFSGLFADGLRANRSMFAKSLKGRFVSFLNMFNQTPQHFPYKYIVSEAIALYYFYLILDYVRDLESLAIWELEIKEHDDFQEEYFCKSEKLDANSGDIRYIQNLIRSYGIVGALVSDISDGEISTKYIRNRLATFVSKNSAGLDTVSQAASLRLKNLLSPKLAVNSKNDLFEMTATNLAVDMSLKTIHIDGVKASCFGLYKLKIEKPDSF